MSWTVLLDAGPLAEIVYARRRDAPILTWWESLIVSGFIVALPEIADYEVRRLLLMRRAEARVRRLDELGDVMRYCPITTTVMRHAAAVWAEARQAGRPFTDDKRLDGDAVLCGHVRTLESSGARVVVATSDVGDLAGFADALRWQDIGP